MAAPRLVIDLDKIEHNARTLVESLATRGISVTGVTKATLGSPEIARSLLRSGVSGLGDSRIENIEAMRHAGVDAPMTLIRSPMLSQVERVVQHADVSFNTDADVIAALSAAAQAARRSHSIVLMVELGDLREGILPADLSDLVGWTLSLPNLDLAGIGTNLACQSGVAPDSGNMDELSGLARSIESTHGVSLDVVSGGNSANLRWASSGCDTGRINDLRLGESILLGTDPLDASPIDGLHHDAIVLVAEVIESASKPSQPRGEVGRTAFGPVPTPVDRGDIIRTILAVGRQDVDPDGLAPPQGISVLGASSDHLVVDSGGHRLEAGSEITFGLDYGALVRSMTSPHVERLMIGGGRDAAGTRVFPGP